ncbi:MAG: MFS transporter, partial [Anaerolineales bacterium]
MMTAIYGVVFSGWSLFFNLYILERGYSREFLGLLNSIPSLAGLLSGLFLGRLADRIGYRSAMILGLTVSIVAMLLQVSLASPELIGLAAFINGVASTLFMISQAPLLMHLADEEETRTLLFSLNYGLQTIAGAVGHLFAGQLPALFGGWFHVPARSAAAYQAVLVTSLLLGSLSILPLWGIKENRIASAGHTQSNIFLALRGQILRMALPNVLIGFGAAILIPYMNVFFVERFEMSARGLGILFSLASLLIGMGSLIAPRLAVRLGGKMRTVI